MLKQPWINWGNARDAAIVLMSVMFTLVAWNLNRQVIRIAPGVETTVTQIKSTAFEAHGAMRAWKEELGDPATIKARNRAQLAIAALAEHAAHVTLPGLDAVPRDIGAAAKQFGQVGAAAERLVAGVDQQLNQQLLPEIVAGTVEFRKLLIGVQAITTQTGADSSTVLKALNELLLTAKTTPEALNARLEDLGRFQAELQKAMEQGTGILTDVNKATDPLPEYTKFAVKWQKPLTYARLISVLAGIFKPY